MKKEIKIMSGFEDLGEDKRLIEDFMEYQEQNVHMKVNKITDTQLRKGLKKDEEVMRMDACINRQKIRIEGWWNCPFKYNGEVLEVFNVWCSPDCKYAFIEVFKNELFLAGKIKAKKENEIIITIEYFRHYENKEYGVYFYCFSVQWNERMGELFSINTETLDIKTRLTISFEKMED